MNEDTISDFEMAVLAAQTRANLRRLLEFNHYEGERLAAFAEVDRQLSSMLRER